MGILKLVNYKKNSYKKRNLLKVFMFIMAIIVILGIVTIIYMAVNNNVSYSKVDSSAKNVSNDEAKSSTPIIMNNVLIGAVYNQKFVSVDKYYFNSVNKTKTKLNLYSKDGMIGEYELDNINKQNNSSTIYVTTSKENLITEYIGVSNTNNLVLKKLTEVSSTDSDTKYVKEALGLYSILNSSVNISKVYQTSINNTDNIRIICATNIPGKSLGAYSAVVIVDEILGEAKCIKYNYVRNVEKSQDFGILAVKFVCDLNNDGINEIILQETKEFETSYIVISYNNKKYFEVLSTSFEI